MVRVPVPIPITPFTLLIFGILITLGLLGMILNAILETQAAKYRVLYSLRNRVLLILGLYVVLFLILFPICSPYLKYL